MGGVPYPLLHRFGGFHWWRFYSLAGFNGSGVSPLYCFPLQVRAVVAMVKFSHLTNFVLNKKLGCIIQNYSLGGCPLSTASSARWLPLVAVHSLQGSMVRVCPLGEMSGNDIAMSGGEMWAVSPIPCFIGSVASIGGGSFLAG